MTMFSATRLPGHPRLTPARPDCAAAHLKGQVEAGRFSEGRAFAVRAASTPLRRRPGHDAPIDTQLLHGEPFRVYAEEEGWAWGQSGADGYVGYCAMEALGAGAGDPTHEVAALRTYVYPGPDLKLPPVMLLSMGAKLAVTGREAGYSRLSPGGYAFTDHLAGLEDFASDYVTVAERFLGTPYLWGGKESLGLDCSGLVQIALHRAGIACPRDTDMQEAVLGVPVTGTMARGDLVFWKGHIAIALDEARILHANATHMAVSIDPLAEFAARVEASAGPITSIRRLTTLGAGE